MHVKRILVPIDFSDQSRKALAEASQVARERDADITLLHVHRITEVAVMDFVYVEPPEKIAEVTEAADKELRRWAEDAGLAEGRWQPNVITGSPINEIIDETKEHDMVVMSTHGRSGFKHFLLGSVAERVVQGAHCSVLIVKEDHK